MKGELHLIDPDGDVLLVVEDYSNDDETKTKGMLFINYIDNGRDNINPSQCSTYPIMQSYLFKPRVG